MYISSFVSCISCAVADKLDLTGTTYALVLNNDWSIIEDDDVLEAIIAEGHIIMALTEGQTWHSHANGRR